MLSDFEFIPAGNVNLCSNSSTFIWKIDNVNEKIANMTVDDRIESPMFFINTNPDTELKFKIWYYPKEYFHLHLASFNDIAIQLKYSLSFVNNKNESVYKHENEHVFHEYGCGWGWCNFVDNKEFLNKSNIIVDDKLKILCKIDINMFSPCNEQQSDVKLIVDEREFFAHKKILAANSPVFAAMFKHDTKENQENIVLITDIHGNVFKALLQYIYMKKITTSNNYLMELAKAAEKYDIRELKLKTEAKLCQNITMDNVFDYLQLAHYYQLDKLYNKTIEFLKSHKNEMKSKETDSTSGLPEELYTKVFNSVMQG